mmetsp:Transcript_17652/g.35529  ORF Transcript_17652/g.35529 Transcript_17652/m.35529 type:complete len:136 (-) Transcript_17652:148-555(-)
MAQCQSAVEMPELAEDDKSDRSDNASFTNEKSQLTDTPTASVGVIKPARRSIFARIRDELYSALDEIDELFKDEPTPTPNMLQPDSDRIHERAWELYLKAKAAEAKAADCTKGKAGSTAEESKAAATSSTHDELV